LVQSLAYKRAGKPPCFQTLAVHPLAPKAPMFPARAKRVIFMYMQGAPSQCETFDYVPGLAESPAKRRA